MAEQLVGNEGAQLLPYASFQMIRGADHHIWTTQAEQMRKTLRRFVRQIAEADRRWVRKLP
jgi:hypothetical protein